MVLPSTYTKYDTYKPGVQTTNNKKSGLLRESFTDRGNLKNVAWSANGEQIISCS